MSVSAHVDMYASNYNHFFVSGNFNAESDNNDETDFCRRYNWKSPKRIRVILFLPISPREKYPNTESFLVLIFLYSDLIQEYGSEITPYLDTFTQCLILTNHLKRFYSCCAQFSLIDYIEVTVMKIPFQKLKSRKVGIEKTNLTVNLTCKLSTTFTLSSLNVTTYFQCGFRKSEK